MTAASRHRTGTGTLSVAMPIRNRTFIDTRWKR
jgi:hypothetical protein